MSFELIFSPRAAERYLDLENNPSKHSVYKQVTKSLNFLKENPRHPSLNTHKHHSLSEQYGIEVFEAYVQHRTPGAYRLFFYYSGKKQITILAITPHS